jgi:hypothetical protein
VPRGRPKKVTTSKSTEVLRLDLGCGNNKLQGFHGVDSIKFDAVDTVLDLRKTPWPWADGSVDEIHCSHFVEHLTREEWVPFFNESYRALKKGGKMRVITPHWSHDCAYGDPTHKSFLSGWVANYLHKGWRDVNAPHCGYTCDFDFVPAGTWDPWLEPRSDEVRMHNMQHATNSFRDLILNLEKNR